MEYRIGTSGWMYKHWLGRLYPLKTKSTELFSFYSKEFNTVELNTTFYHLPLPSTIKKWREGAPEDFLYAVKASRYITHNKKLLDSAESLKTFINRVKPLKEKLGPILFQTPPALKCDPERLKKFLKLLPKKYRFVIEFRNKTWFTDEVYEILCEKNVGLCIYDIAGFESPRLTTADFFYIRLHGPSEHKYAGSYSDEALKSWAHFMKSTDLPGYVYFDNDAEGFAPANALTLKRLLSS